MTTPERAHLPGAKLVAWISFVFGTIVSVAFNVLAAFLPPEHAPPKWVPSIWAVVFSTVWPLGLLLSVELLARTAQRRTVLAYLIRYGGMSVVAVFSAVISYQHIRAVLLDWHYAELSATVGPFVIDGLMVLAGYAMVQGSVSVLAVPEPVQTPEKATRKQPEPKQPEPAPKSSQEAAVTRVFGPELPPERVTMPLKRTNGHRVAAAIKTGARPRPARVSTTDGLTDAEYVERIKARLAASEKVTKRDVAREYRMGSDRAGRILRIAKGEEEA